MSHQSITITLGGVSTNWFPDQGALHNLFVVPQLQFVGVPVPPPYKRPAIVLPLPDLITWVKVGHEQPNFDFTEWLSEFISNMHINIIGFLVDLVETFIPGGFPWPDINLPLGEKINLEVIFNGQLAAELAKPNIQAALDLVLVPLTVGAKTGKDALIKLQSLIGDAMVEAFNTLKDLPKDLYEAARILQGGDPLQVLADIELMNGENGLIDQFLDSVGGWPDVPTFTDIMDFVTLGGYSLTFDGLNDALGDLTGIFDLDYFNIPPVPGAEVGRFGFMYGLKAYMAKIGTVVLQTFVNLWNATIGAIFENIFGIELEIPELVITIPIPDTPINP